MELDDFVDWLILTRSRQRSSGGEQRNEKALLGLMDENKIAVLSAGDGFGEGALTRSSGARGATIVTNCETEFAVLKKETYDLNVKAHQQEQVAAAAPPWLPPPPASATSARRGGASMRRPLRMQGPLFHAARRHSLMALAPRAGALPCVALPCVAERRWRRTWRCCSRTRC